MKNYYKISRTNYSNEYALRYEETPEDVIAMGCIEELYPTATITRITRREAERLAAQERRRRVTDEAFSGYADNAVYPASDADADARGWYSRHERRGYIWERI